MRTLLDYAKERRSKQIERKGETLSAFPRIEDGLQDKTLVLNGIILRFDINAIKKFVLNAVHCYDAEGLSIKDLKKIFNKDRFYPLKGLVCSLQETNKLEEVSEYHLSRLSKDELLDLFSFSLNSVTKSLLEQKVVENELLDSSEKHRYVIFEKIVNGRRLRFTARFSWSEFKDDLIALKLALNACVYEGDKCLSIATLQRDVATYEDVKHTIQSVAKEILNLVAHKLASQGIHCTIVSLKTLNKLGVVYRFTKVMPCVRLRFRYGYGLKPKEIFVKHPYSIDCDKINVLIAYWECNESEANYLIKELHHETLKYRFVPQLEFNAVQIDSVPTNKPLLTQLKLRKELLACKEKCHSGLFVLPKGVTSEAFYNAIKAFSFKQGFYFKAQIINVESIKRMMQDKESREEILAHIINSIVFRAEGTPFLPLVVDSSTDIDELADRLVVGISFSRPTRESPFTMASIAIVDVYGGHISVETVDLGTKVGPLKLEESDVKMLVDRISNMVKNYRFNEVGIYVSKKLSSEEIQLFKEMVMDRLGGIEIILASIVRNPMKSIVRNPDKLLLVIQRGYSVSIYQWTHRNQEYPLQVDIYSSVSNINIDKELKLLNVLRYLYYPAASPIHTDIAPTIYARRVAKVAPYLKKWCI